MGNGGILGKRNPPTRQRASGVWGLHDLYFNSIDSEWPTGNLRVEVGSFTKQAGTGNQDIAITTDCTGATVAAVIFWVASGSSVSGTWYGLAFGGIGYAAKGATGTITEYAYGHGSANGSGAADLAHRISNKAVVFNDNVVGGYGEANFVGFTSATNMRINWTAAGSYLPVINYMVISNISDAKVIPWTTPASIGNKAVTGVGFSPDLVLHAGCLTAPTTSSAYMYSMFGAQNRHGQQWSNSIAGQDGVASGATSRWSQTDSCIAQVAESDTLLLEAKHVSMDADGFTNYFTSVSGARTVISLCLSGISSKLGAFTASGTSQTIDSHHGFVPKGLLMTTNGRAPISIPEPHATWGIGATDMVNKRASYLTDIDAVTPTQAHSVWYSGKVLVTHAGAGVTESTYDLASSGTDSFNLTMSANPGGDEVLYMLLGEAGTDTFPATINENNSSVFATAYSNQKKGVELSTGRKVIIDNFDGGTALFYWSDDGQDWTGFGGSSPIFGWSNGSIDAYVDSGGTERLVAVWKQSGTGGSRTDGKLYIMIGSFSADRTTLTWGSALAHTADVSDPTLDYPDVVAFAEGTGGHAFMVFSGIGNSTRNFTFATQFSISSGGVPTQGAHDQISPGHPGYGVLVHTFPSVDYDPAAKRLFVAWSAGTTGSGKGIRFRTASYSSGSWNWAAEVEVSTTHHIFAASSTTDRGLVCRWDAGRSLAVIAGFLYTGSGYTITIWDSSDFSNFTARVNTAADSATGAFSGMGAAIDASTGDVYIFGSKYTGTVDEVAYRKATRTGSSLSLGSRVVVDSFGGHATAPPHVNAFPVTGGIGWVYRSGNNAPYAVKYDRLQL